MGDLGDCTVAARVGELADEPGELLQETPPLESQRGITKCGSGEGQGLAFSQSPDKGITSLFLEENSCATVLHDFGGAATAKGDDGCAASERLGHNDSKILFSRENEGASR